MSKDQLRNGSADTNSSERIVGPLEMKGDEQFDWGALVPHLVHPLKVATIEALLWIKEPLSVSDFARLLDEKFNKPLITRHLDKLAEADALVVTRKQRTRGLPEKLYFFPRGREE